MAATSLCPQLQYSGQAGAPAKLWKTFLSEVDF
jgi:hypothetical protein